MHRLKIRILGCLLPALLLVSLSGRAEVVLPKILGHSMVLQRNQPVPVWGKAADGEVVTVQFGSQLKKTTTNADGDWKVLLNAMPASAQGQTLLISGTNTIRLNDVLVGEVWLCSGQSNMQYEMRKNSKVRKPDTSTVNSPVDELERAHNPVIRIFMGTQKNLLKPDTTHHGWSIAQDSALRAFSAAGYFFAKNLQARLQVPVGVICSSVSGSRIEPWIPAEAFTQEPYLESIEAEGDPGKFYQKMIAPLAPFAIKGWLWYQGESNCFLGETISYIYKMQALVNSWRKLWQDDKLPFYYVQIAPFFYSKSKGQVTYTPQTLPEFREAQTAALQIPHTGMIVTTDLNDDINNLHPPFKWEVGRRLALLALANTYGDKQLVYLGPTFKRMKTKGNRVELEFDHIGSGLASHDGKPLTYFTIAGADGKFVAADAIIKGNKVIVSSSSVSNPANVRFAWVEDAQPNFYNKDGLPAAPFRTDNPLHYTYQP